MPQGYTKAAQEVNRTSEAFTVIDKTTKIALVLLALGLWFNALAPLVRPRKVSAGSPSKCTGEIRVKELGATTAGEGGYDVTLNCSE